MKIKLGEKYRFLSDGENIPKGTAGIALWENRGEVGFRFGDGLEAQIWTVRKEELEPHAGEEEKVIGEVYDPVSKPKHYQLLPGVEVIDVLDALCDKLDNSTLLYNKEVSYYAQAMGYFMRAMDKNGLQDFEKGVWYMQRVIKNIKERQNAGLE